MYLVPYVLNAGKWTETAFNSEGKGTQSHALDPLTAISERVCKSIQPGLMTHRWCLTLGNHSSATHIQGEPLPGAGFLTIKADPQECPDSLNF